MMRKNWGTLLVGDMTASIGTVLLLKEVFKQPERAEEIAFFAFEPNHVIFSVIILLAITRLRRAFKEGNIIFHTLDYMGFVYFLLVLFLQWGKLLVDYERSVSFLLVGAVIDACLFLAFNFLRWFPAPEQETVQSARKHL